MIGEFHSSLGPIDTNDCPPPDHLAIVYGESHPELAKLIANNIEKLSSKPVPLVPGIKLHFADSSSLAEYGRSIRGSHVFVVQPTDCGGTVDMNIMQAAFMGDAARRASATQISLVDTCIGYARQDRAKGRQSTSSRVVLDIYNTYYSRLITVNPHSRQALDNGFRGAIDPLGAEPFLAYELKQILDQEGVKEIVAVSPDQTGVERLDVHIDHFTKAGIEVTGTAHCIKRHLPGANKVEIVDMVGDVDGKKAVIVDDMIDTSGTQIESSLWCQRKGASEIYAVAAHAVFSPTKLEDGTVKTPVDRLMNSPIKRVIVTNSLPINSDYLECPRLSVVDISPLLAETIFRIANNYSVRTMFP